jgi:hypothetical protein
MRASMAARPSRLPPRRDATWRNFPMWYPLEVQQTTLTRRRARHRNQRLT